MKSMIPDWLPKLFVKAEGTVREATTKKFSDFQKITDTEGMEVVGLKGGANVRADILPATTSMIATEPDEVLRNSKGQFMSTKEIPELANQKEVNRFLWESIESIDAGGGEGAPTNDPRITDDQIDDWDLSVSWGNHAEAGYAKASDIPEVPDIPEWDYEFTPNTLVQRNGSGDIKAKKVVGQLLQMTSGGSTPNARPADTIFYSSTNNQLNKNNAEGMRAALGITGEHDSANKGQDYRYELNQISENIANRPGHMHLNNVNAANVTRISFYVTDADSKPMPHVAEGYFVEFSHDDGDVLYKVLGADNAQFMMVEWVSGDMVFQETVTYQANVYPLLSSLWNGDDFMITGTYHSKDGNFVGEGFGLKFDNDTNSVVPIAANGNPKVGIDLGSSAAKFKDGEFTGKVSATSFKGDGSEITNISTRGVALDTESRNVLPEDLATQKDVNLYLAETLDKLLDDDGNPAGGGFDEAPLDGQFYIRRNGAWEVFVPPSGGGAMIAVTQPDTAGECALSMRGDGGSGLIKSGSWWVNKDSDTATLTVPEGLHFVLKNITCNSKNIKHQDIWVDGVRLYNENSDMGKQTKSPGYNNYFFDIETNYLAKESVQFKIQSSSNNWFHFLGYFVKAS